MYTKRHTIKQNLPSHIHLMNKNEAKALRQLMAKTGLSEKEIRANKKYRIILSEAQDKGEKQLTYNQKKEKYFRDIFKIITRRLELPKEHPLVIQAVKDYIELEKSLGYYSFSY